MSTHALRWLLRSWLQDASPVNCENRLLAKDYTCGLPVTQAELADATGLSTVHVNRTLQELRGKGLIELQSGTFLALDWEGLREAAGFDPAYLPQLAPGLAI